MPGDVGKEGIGYEEEVLAFILCAPFDLGASEFLDLENARMWEINPKLFNSEILQIPFTIDVDFFVKKGAVYHIFFSKSSRKLAKNSPKIFFEKALGTFCVLESRGQTKLQEKLKYYFISDVIPWRLVEGLPTRDVSELSSTLMKAMGCPYTKECREMFSATIIAKVKQKTRFCQVDERLIKERRDRFPDKFKDLLGEISPAKREVEQSITGLYSDISLSQVSIGSIDNPTGKKYTLGRVTFWIGNLAEILDVAKRLEKSAKKFEIVKKLVDKTKFTFTGQTEVEAITNLFELFNRIIFPENELETSLIITLNNYDGIFFKHKEVAMLIRKKFDYHLGKYNLANVPVLNKLDQKTAIIIAKIAFSKGRSIELTETRFIFQ
jgi:hypothetical protein